MVSPSPFLISVETPKTKFCLLLFYSLPLFILVLVRSWFNIQSAQSRFRLQAYDSLLCFSDSEPQGLTFRERFNS